MKLAAAVVAAVAGLALTATPVWPFGATPDVSFSGVGYRLDNAEGDAAGLEASFGGAAILPDDTVLAVGRQDRTGGGLESLIAHFKADGSPDTAFAGGQGVASLPLDTMPAKQSALDKLAVLPNGDFVVAGLQIGTDTSRDLLVARFHANGTLDTGFGGVGGAPPGVFVYSGVQDMYVGGVAVQSDGKVLVGGWDADGISSHDRVFVLRVAANGQALDSSFATPAGIDRRQLQVPSALQIFGASMAVDSHGAVHLAVAGATTLGSDTISTVVWDTDGQLDASHTAGGCTAAAQPAGTCVHTVPAGSPQIQYPSLAIADDDSSFIAASDVSGLGRLGVLIKENADGTDGTLPGGVVALPFTPRDVSFLPGNRVAVAGTKVDAGDDQLAAEVVTTSGALDLGFNPSASGDDRARLFAAPATGEWAASAVAPASDGRLVLVGSRGGSPNRKALIARYGDAALTADSPTTSLNATVGQSATADVTLRNTGGTPVTITGLTVSAGDWATTDPNGCSGRTLQPAETCVAPVTFTPTAAGDRDATLTVSRASTTLTVNLHGTATAPSVPAQDPVPGVPAPAVPPPADTFRVVFRPIVTGVGQQATVTALVHGKIGDYTYSWDFDGDGTIDLPDDGHSQAVLRMLKAGIFKIGVVVTKTATGERQTATTTITVNSPLHFARPKVPDSVIAGRPFKVDISATADKNAAVSAYRFDFGDHSAPAYSDLGPERLLNVDASRKPTRTHTYAKRGSYNATFTAVGIDGQSVSINRTIVVRAPSATRKASTAPTANGEGGQKNNTGAGGVGQAKLQLDSPSLTIVQTGDAVSNPIYYVGEPPDIVDGGQDVEFDVTGPYSYTVNTAEDSTLELSAIVELLTEGAGGPVEAKALGALKFSDPAGHFGTTLKAGAIALGRSAAVARAEQPIAHAALIGGSKKEVLGASAVWDFGDDSPTESSERPNGGPPLSNAVTHVYTKAGTYTVSVTYVPLPDPETGVMPKDRTTLVKHLKVVVRPPLCRSFKIANTGLVGHTPDGVCLHPTGLGSGYKVGSRFVRVGALRLSGGTIAGATMYGGAITGTVGDGADQLTILATNALAFPKLKKGKGIIFAKNQLSADPSLKAINALLKQQGQSPVALPDSGLTIGGLPIVDVAPIEIGNVYTETDLTLKLPAPLGQRIQHVRAAGPVKIARAATDDPAEQENSDCKTSGKDFLHTTATGFAMCIKDVPILPGIVTAKDIFMVSDGADFTGGGRVLLTLAATSGELAATLGFNDGALHYMKAHLISDQGIAIGPISLEKLGVEIKTDPFFFKGDVTIGFPAPTSLIKAHGCVQIQSITKGDIVGICLDHQPTFVPHGLLRDTRTFKADSDETGVFVQADVRVLGIPLGSGYAFLFFKGKNGFAAKIGGHIGAGIDGLISLSGEFGVDFAYSPTPIPGVGDNFAFQADVTLEGCLIICVDVNALINNKWLVGCVHIVFVHVGGGIGLRGQGFTFFGGLGGCDLLGSSYAFDIPTRRSARDATPEPAIGSQPVTEPPPGPTLSSDLRNPLARLRLDNKTFPPLKFDETRCQQITVFPGTPSLVFVFYGDRDAPDTTLITPLGGAFGGTGQKDGYGTSYSDDIIAVAVGPDGNIPDPPPDKIDVKIDLKGTYGIDSSIVNTTIFEVHNPPSGKYCTRGSSNVTPKGGHINITNVVYARAASPYEIQLGSTSQLPKGKARAASFVKLLAGGQKAQVLSRAQLRTGESVTFVSKDKDGLTQVIGHFDGPPLAKSARAAAQQRATDQVLLPQRTVRKKLTWEPLDGPAGKRTIIAYPSRFGLPGPSMKVGSYVVPKRVVRKPGRVLSTRTANGLSIRWLPSPDAASYEVTVQTPSRAKSVLTVPAKRRHLDLSLFAKTSRATIKVVTVKYNGARSTPSVVKVKPVARFPKHIVVTKA